MKDLNKIKYSYPHIDAYFLGQIDYETAINQTVSDLNHLIEEAVFNEFSNKFGCLHCRNVLCITETTSDGTKRINTCPMCGRKIT